MVRSPLTTSSRRAPIESRFTSKTYDCRKNDSWNRRQNRVKRPGNSEHCSTDRPELARQGSPSVAALSLVLAGLVVGITVCVAIGYIVFLQPNPDSNVPDLPPSDAVVETPPDETSSTTLSLSPSSKPENASEATSVGLPARDIQKQPPS